MSSAHSSALTPSQVRILDDLLAIGAPRPSCSAGIASDMTERISSRLDPYRAAWTESSFFLSKSTFLDHARCEGMALARAAERTQVPTGPLLRGKAAHRAIQMSYTHPHVSPDGAVRAALSSICDEDEDSRSWWDGASPAEQSDTIVGATSVVVNFLDDFPPLDPSWSPRFEEPISARAGILRLSVRADLTLGRPRGDGRQTMLLIDFKSGALNESHTLEASFYALVATLRHGVAPWRSVVFSLADGSYTDPDVDERRLLDTADLVSGVAARHMALMLEQDSPVLAPGPHCRFCPSRYSCPSSSL